MKKLSLIFVFAAVSILSLNLFAKEGHNYLAESKRNIGQVLSHPILNQYPDYLVENFREGEFGESQAFFVRLAKPFSDSDAGICIVFLDFRTVASAPHNCEAAE